MAPDFENAAKLRPTALDAQTDLVAPVNTTLVGDLSSEEAQENLAKDLADAMDEEMRTGADAGRILVTRQVTVGVLADAIKFFLRRHPGEPAPQVIPSGDGNLYLCLFRS